MSSAVRAGRYGSIVAVPTVSRWWSSRTDPQRIELYTRSSFYSFAWGLPLLALLVTSSIPGMTTGRALPYLACTVLAAGAVYLLARAGMAVARRGGELDSRAWSPAAAAALVTPVVAVVSFRPLAGDDVQLVMWASLLVPGLVLCALGTVWQTRRLLQGSAVVGLTGGVVVLVCGEPVPVALVLVVVVTITIAFMATSFRFTMWLLDVVQGMERSRGVELQLAVAEERLRFARDLHDVMGRNLSAIAVKGQLAEQLVRRGRPGVAEEVADISRIAEESLREVREVVRGYRGTDLAGELAGARSVLRAAGVSCTVHGEDVGRELAEPVQTSLAWVVREAVTNVLRHSVATTCTIGLRREAAEVELRVTNDGVPAATPPPQWGSGLTGLAERLQGAGRLTAAVDGGRFTVTARVSV